MVWLKAYLLDIHILHGPSIHLRPCLIRRRSAGSVQPGAVIENKHMHFGKYYLLLLSLIMGILGNAHASVPVPYAGKVSIDGVNFDGQLKFMFAIYTASNDMVWDSGGDPIEVPVSNGRYLVLLGGQGMRPLPASLFHENDELYVGVYADLPNDDVGQVSWASFSGSPPILMPWLRRWRRWQILPQGFEAGAIMIQSSSITTAQLNEQILNI